MVAHGVNPSTQRSETGISVWVGGQFRPHIELSTSQGHIVITSLKKLLNFGELNILSVKHAKYATP